MGRNPHIPLRASALALATALLAATAGALAADRAQASAAQKSVIGGRFASVAQFPYAAAIRVEGKLACSGALISPTRVLTAGHCARYAPHELTVVLGRNKVSGGGGQVLGVTSAAIHPGFSKGRKGALYNDIGVLALAGSTSLPPIALPSGDDLPFVGPGSVLTLAAYGERQANLLRKSRVGRLSATPLRSRARCHTPGFSAATMICALGKRYAVAISGRQRRGVHRSGCFGDSGGPLIGHTASGPTVFGVTSFGGMSPRKFFHVLCGLKRKPGVYTRVAPYVPWIQANL